MSSSSLLLSDNVMGINWQRLAEIFERAPLGRRDPAVLETQFRNSQERCFAYLDGTLIGAGRALTDRVGWTVLFDVVIDPDFQGQGYGSRVVAALVERAGAKNVMLHSVPGREEFYRRLSFRRMRTAMARYGDSEKAIQSGYVEGDSLEPAQGRGGVHLSV